jgi:DNA polymerase-3 subunit chi
MTEVRFYHLLERPLEAVLPVMLARCLERGWRAVVRGGNPARLDALDRILWTHDEESFLPHGRAGAAPGAPADHPIWLTEGEELPNAPDTLFLIDGAAAGPAALSPFGTVALLFDGTDAAATERARAAWRAVTAAGMHAVYWAEDGRGGWAKRAEAGG